MGGKHRRPCDRTASGSTGEGVVHSTGWDGKS